MTSRRVDREGAFRGGKQAGDPVRAGEVMIAVTEAEHPPRHLLLGRWGHDAVAKKLRERLEEIDAWRSQALAADFPDA